MRGSVSGAALWRRTAGRTSTTEAYNLAWLIYRWCMGCGCCRKANWAGGSGSIKLRNGREEHVTLHLLEGSKEEIEAQLKQSIDAFFDIYPEIQ